MKYIQWDIILVRFPFTDLSSEKLRPALVISNKYFNQDENLMLIGIYGNQGNKNYSLPLQQDRLDFWKMKKQSYLRYHNIFSLHKTLITRKIAHIKKPYLSKIFDKLFYFLKLT